MEIPKSDGSSHADVESVRYTPPKCKGVMEESGKYASIIIILHAYCLWTIVGSDFFIIVILFIEDDFSNYFNGKEAEKNIGDQNNDLHIELRTYDD